MSFYKKAASYLVEDIKKSRDALIALAGFVSIIVIFMTIVLTADALKCSSLTQCYSIVDDSFSKKAADAKKLLINKRDHLLKKHHII